MTVQECKELKLPNAPLGVKVGTIHGWPKQYPSFHWWHDNWQII